MVTAERRMEAADTLLAMAEDTASRNLELENDVRSGCAGTCIVRTCIVRTPIHGNEAVQVINDGSATRYFPVRSHFQGADWSTPEISRLEAQERIAAWLEHQQTARVAVTV